MYNTGNNGFYGVRKGSIEPRVARVVSVGADGRTAPEKKFITNHNTIKKRHNVKKRVIKVVHFIIENSENKAVTRDGRVILTPGSPEWCQWARTD